MTLNGLTQFSSPKKIIWLYSPLINYLTELLDGHRPSEKQKTKTASLLIAYLKGDWHTREFGFRIKVLLQQAWCLLLLWIHDGKEELLNESIDSETVFSFYNPNPLERGPKLHTQRGGPLTKKTSFTLSFEIDDFKEHPFVLYKMSTVFQTISSSHNAALKCGKAEMSLATCEQCLWEHSHQGLYLSLCIFISHYWAGKGDFDLLGLWKPNTLTVKTFQTWNESHVPLSSHLLSS